MSVLLCIFSFALGTIVGSFLNVVALRYNSGMTLFGRSRCFACSVTLRWFDLVPIASFLVLRGRCRGCGSAISMQYPIVELITGVVFALVFLQQATVQQATSPIQHALLSLDVLRAYGLLLVAYWWLVFSLLIAISVYDLRHKIIPDGLVYAFIALAFLYVIGAWSVFGNWNLEFRNLFYDTLPAIFFALLWLLSRGRAMGLGDAKLVLGMGWLLGLFQGIAAIVLSFWLGALVSLCVLLAQRVRLFSTRATLTMKSEIPFGPFLVAGTFLAWFFGLDVVAIVGWF